MNAVRSDCKISWCLQKRNISMTSAQIPCEKHVCQNCILTAEYILIRTFRAASANPRRPLLFVRLLRSYGVVMQICLLLKSVRVSRGLLQTSKLTVNRAVWFCSSIFTGRRKWLWLTNCLWRRQRWCKVYSDETGRISRYHCQDNLTINP